MSDKKKITAAVSAVMSYLQEEAAAIAMNAASQDYIETAPPVSPALPTRFWAASGRQAQMQMRNMMQLKAFHRLR